MAISNSSTASFASSFELTLTFSTHTLLHFVIISLQHGSSALQKGSVDGNHGHNEEGKREFHDWYGVAGARNFEEIIL
jgi:hypothetical protein